MTRPSGPAPRGPERHRATVERLADAFVPRRLHGYREQIHYLAVGGWNTLFGYLSFVVLYYFLNGVLPLTAILVLSYVISVANAYICYRYVVFRSRDSILRELPRFTSVYLVALAANLVVLPLALHYLPLSAYVVQALFTLAVVLLSYVGHRYFSFGGRQGNADTRETSAKGPDSGGE
jgi:putative flippase GtrA